jgi:hypothetical protein
MDSLIYLSRHIFSKSWAVSPGGLGEAVLTLWLLIAGVNTRQAQN